MLRTILSAGLAASALTFATATATSAQPMPPETYPFKSGPVTITSCSLGQSGSGVADNSLEIKYFQNVPRRHLISVTFFVRYAGQVANVTDSGKFSFGAPIDHKFNALSGTPWSGPDPAECRVTSATFGDGQTVQPSYAPMGDAEHAPMSGPPGTMPPYATQPGAAAPSPAAT